MAIDYNKLLNDPRFYKRVSQKRYAKYLEDEDALSNDIAKGKMIMSLGWDGNFPGNSGAIWVTRWKGFYFCHSSDYDPEGPFDSLDDVFGLEWFYVATARPILESDEIPLPELMKIATRLVSENGDVVVINNAAYAREGDQLVKVLEEA
jgi:hypothetical protein